MIESIIKNILDNLPPRGREVLKRRAGLNKNNLETLESIGSSLGITRERVRQIENSSITLAKAQVQKLQDFLRFEDFVKEYLHSLGGARREDLLFRELSFLLKEEHFCSENRIAFLLRLSDKFLRNPPDKRFYAFWAEDYAVIKKVLNFLKILVQELKKKNSPLSLAEADKFLSYVSKKSGMSNYKVGALIEFAHISKEIDINPYGEWGLTHWRAIVPSSVRDRIYYVLRQHQKPLHFVDIANYINRSAKFFVDFHPAWRKLVDVQTVHNELIKDERFILVGRGLYALKEWGYKPGAVKDVIFEVLREAGRPLSKEELIRLVKEKKLVKDSTILINLHTSKSLHKTEDGKYYLPHVEKGMGPVQTS